MLTKELQKHIRKLVGTPKDEEEIKLVLKARLTKREFKLLSAWSEDLSREEIDTMLKLGDDEQSNLSKKLIKKLNQEKFKQELIN